MPYIFPTNVTGINLRKETLASRPDVFEATDVWVAEVRAGASLSFLRENQNLRSLRIQDAEQLTGLEQLTQIDTLYSLARLRYMNIAWIDGLRMEDYAALSRNLPHAVGSCLQPCYTYNFPTFCKRCRQRTVFLTGARPRSRREICPSCGREHLDRHVQAWNAAGGRPFVTPKSASEVDIEQLAGADG